MKTQNVRHGFRSTVAWLLLALVVSASVLVVLASPVPPTTSPWLTHEPILASLALPNTNYENMINNRDCYPQEVVTRPARVIPFQSKLSHTACVTNAGFGALASTGYLQLIGDNAFGTIRSASGGSATLIGIPNSLIGITIGGNTGNGSYLNFYDTLPSAIHSSAALDGQLTHYLPNPNGRLQDKAGNALGARVDSMGFSSNGDWMVVDLPGIATVRVNTASREVLPFGQALNYSIGVDPNLKTAVGPDGRYAAVASKEFSYFRIYDLETCAEVPATIVTKVNCDFKDLNPFMQQKIGGYKGISSLRFHSDYTIDVYAVVNTDLKHYVLTAGGQPTAPAFQYLALGDSFASGEGAYQYKASTDTSSNRCHLSQRSYPFLLGADLNLGVYNSIACSGAKIEDLLREDPGYLGQVRDGRTKQNRNLDEILIGPQPGYIAQKDFVARYQPATMTLSVGGNDIGFADKIIRCLMPDSCFHSYEDRLEITNEIDAQFYRLVGANNEIKQNADPRAQLYVVGYPQIADPNGNCALNVHLNHDELLFSQQLIHYLNSVIQKAAANTGVTYIDVEDAFQGHRFCETDSWQVAVNGLTAGNDIVNVPFFHGPIGKESFHPNAFGQWLLEQAILRKTTSFGLPPVAPDPAQQPEHDSAYQALLNAPKSLRTVRTIRNYAGSAGKVIETGKAWTSTYANLTPFFKADSTAEVWLDGLKVGSTTIGAFGETTVQLTLPPSIAPGAYMLHLYGTNLAGDPVDAYESVYVSDGQHDLCNVIGKSGIDKDQDGIDDACDDLIGQAPLEVTLAGGDVEVKPSIATAKTSNVQVVLASAEQGAQQSNSQNVSQSTPQSLESGSVLAVEVTQPSTTITLGEPAIDRVTPSRLKTKSEIKKMHPRKRHSNCWLLLAIAILLFLFGLLMRKVWRDRRGTTINNK